MSEQKIHPAVSAAILAAAMLFNYVSRYESQEVLARKPAAIETLRARARRNCKPSGEPGAEMDDDARLTQTLDGALTRSLETLAEKQTTICLDSRLAHQNTGFFNKRAIAVYHAKDNVLALYDNGRNVATFFEMSAKNHGADVVEKVAADMRDGDLSRGENTVAARYNCGKNCTTTRLKPLSAFDQSTVGKNPGIFHVPSIRSLQPEAAW